MRILGKSARADLTHEHTDLSVSTVSRQQRLQHSCSADGLAQRTAALKQNLVAGREFLLRYGDRSKAGSTLGAKRAANNTVQ